MENNKKLKVMLIQEDAPPAGVGKQVLRTDNINYDKDFKNKTIEQALNLAKDYKIRQRARLRANKISNKKYVENLYKVNKAVAFETGYNLMAFRAREDDERNADLVRTEKIKNNNEVNDDNIANHIKIRKAKYLPVMTSTYKAFASDFDRPLSINDEGDKTVLYVGTKTDDPDVTEDPIKISDLDDAFKPYANDKYKNIPVRLFKVICDKHTEWTKRNIGVEPDKEKEKEDEDKKDKKVSAPRVESNVAQYDIKSGKPKTRFIRSFQRGGLSRFYNNVTDKKLAPIIKGYQQGKFLSDGKYGYRTHHISREAINYLLIEVEKAKKEQRGGLDYNNTFDLLKGLKSDFDSVWNKASRPLKRTMISATLIARLDNLLRLLRFKNGKVTNLDRLGRGGGVAGRDVPADGGKRKKKKIPTPAIARKPAPKPREASCWYAQNITFGGEQATSPNALFSRTPNVETFDEWYEKIMTVVGYTGHSASYTFLGGARASYKAQLETMGSRRSTNINIQCFITIANALNRVLNTLGNTAEANHPKNPKALSEQARYFLNNGKYAGSLAQQCQTTLYKVVMNAMQNQAPKILNAAEKLKQGGNNRAARVVAQLVGDRAAQKIAGTTPTGSIKEGLISELILIKIEE